MSATKPLKVIFAGTPEFAVVALQALLNSSHEIKAVYTQPDRPAGRGQHLTASPVKQLALQNNLPIQQPLTLRDAAVQQKLTEYQADVIVVAAYGLLFPLDVLNIPRFGCINIHPSLLPRWRGAAPIQRTILAGDKQTGVTIMQMAAGLDSGPMLYQEECAVGIHDTSATLHDTLANLGAKALLQTLDKLAHGNVKSIPQNDQAATYAKKITKEEARLNWNSTAAELDHKIRAFNPWPVAFTTLGAQTFRIWQASVENATVKNTPGIIDTISAKNIRVATAQGYLCLEKLQIPGGKIITAADMMNATRQLLSVGDVLA